ncbi:phosphatidylinositol-specific phospholipase C/glycerophosphodiester phosphodiesterase family protein [Niabella sp. 3A5MI-3]|nr:phosphatidylinositol-specific phospholipase C/glycerophosphodiester phosphodiesterase family protein [Niabella beijingensis]
MAQPAAYTVQNAHSHNDYEQQRPFRAAFEQEFGSIEADVFFVNDDLPVAHNARDIRPERNLKQLYLDPIRQLIRENNGTIYKDPGKKLLLLIDCKTEGKATLDAIIKQLEHYPEITGNKTVRIVITGNQPDKDSLAAYPGFIWFDGDLAYHYKPENLEKVALFSANFRQYSSWNGSGQADAASTKALEAAIRHAHEAGKPIRFWGAPDNTVAWTYFKKLGTDYINTDKIPELARFLREGAR